MRRKKYASWDRTFMRMAEALADRSKDPDTQIGAIIVNEQYHIIGAGYNGLPEGMDDKLNDGCWKKANKQHYIIHAENNAILNATADLTNATLYLHSKKGYLPCSKCAQMIAQKKIKKVLIDCPDIEVTSKHCEDYNFDATKDIFKQCNITIARVEHLA